MQLFGLEITRKNKPLQQTVIEPVSDDGSTVITSASAGYYSQVMDLEARIKNENDLIRRYREVAQYSDCDSAIEDIVNEAIVAEDDKQPVELNLDELKLSASIKTKITDEFKNVLSLLRFSEKGHDIFRTWYTDGRLYYHVLTDETNPKNGIVELRPIDPRKIRKIKNIKKEKSAKGIEIVKSIEEYYLYNDKGITETTINGVRLPMDAVVYTPSGLVDANSGMILGYLHKAIKLVNQLKMMEDSLVIYRISRAPERRIFYVDVGNLPKLKAEQYVNDLMNKFRNKVVYDATTGEVRSDRQHLCLAMDTRVPLLDGRTLTISEIATEYKNRQLWAYSCDPVTGQFAPGLITWAGVSRPNAKVMRLTLDNGETITCTPEHRFPVWDKGMVEAQNLLVGESMMPTHKEEVILNPEITKIEFLEDHADTGCLTIDGDEKYHNNHTFALAAGIYTQNSMTEDYWMPRRGSSGGTEITTLPGGCFSMNTKVSLMDGRELSIREIESELALGKELWTYSCDEYSGEIKPGLISWAGVTQKSAKVMRLTLDNGEEIICTPDHKFPIYGKGFVEAKDLDINESFVPLYRKRNVLSHNNKLEYEMVFDNKSKKWIYTHRMVRAHIELPFTVYDENQLERYDQYVTHHIDCNRFNNSPNNLCRMSFKDHSADWHDFRIKESVHNHRLAKIEYLDDSIEVGTLTIDTDEIFHSHHTFALSAGVFTKNSNLSAMEDVNFFQQKLFQALNVPMSRLKGETGFNIGRSSEITRDEIKFNKFVQRIRKRFASLFLDTLRVQLILKGIVTPDDWDTLRNEIRFNFMRDNFFSELKDSEILQSRMATLQNIDPYVGKYYDINWVRKNVLQQSDEDITEIDKGKLEDRKAELEIAAHQGQLEMAKQPSETDTDQSQGEQDRQPDER